VPRREPSIPVHIVGNAYEWTTMACPDTCRTAMVVACTRELGHLTIDMHTGPPVSSVHHWDLGKDQHPLATWRLRSHMKCRPSLTGRPCTGRKLQELTSTDHRPAHASCILVASSPVTRVMLGLELTPCLR
jgi:hypothetical protein